MKALVRGLFASAIVLVSTVSACSSRDVVVFEVEPDDQLPASDASAEPNLDAAGLDAGSDDAEAGSNDAEAGSDAGDAEPPPIVCNDLFDCPAYWFCLKNSCSDPTGICEPRPVFCPWDVDPVCGCNGVTYWNDCLRQQLGSAASSQGECHLNAIPCNNGGDCGFPGAACARLLFPDQECPPRESVPAPGTCWAIPPDCNAVPDEQRWRHCPFPDDPPGYIPPCVNTCWAIRSEWVHLQAQVDTCD